jgi:hypothetical protein
MAKQPHSFKRLVLGLQPSAADRAMQIAAELADLLNLELHGLLFEDTSLRDLAGMPFARELRTLGGGWHAIDVERLSREFDRAARNVERIFAEAARRLATRSQFEIARGPIGQAIASISRAGDIVMIVEPLSAAERASQQFAWLLRAAFASAPAVMLVPRHIVRSKGPIVAIATWPEDPSIEVAAAIAIAAQEELVVIEADGQTGEAPPLRVAAEAGLSVKRMTARRAHLPDPATCAQAFRFVQERLIVLTRGAFEDGVASALAAARRVPVLVVEPAAVESPAQ